MGWLERMVDAKHGRVLTLLAISAAVVTLAGCGPPDPDRDPGPKDLGSFEFDVAETIEVADSGVDPTELTVELGDVVMIENVGDESARLRGDGLDTGKMEPGEAVTVVLSDEGEVVWQLVGHENDKADRVTLDVKPDPAAD